MSQLDDESFLRRVAETAREVPPASVDLEARIMAAVRATPRRWWHALLAWLTRPRTVRLSPVAGLVYAAGLAAVAVIASRALPARPGSPAPPAAVDTIQTIRFILHAPGAASVALVGDFNRWSPSATPLRPSDVVGVWTVDVPLPAGRHEYAFVVNGTEWRADPTAPRAPGVEFGPANSMITVIPELS